MHDNSLFKQLLPLIAVLILNFLVLLSIGGASYPQQVAPFLQKHTAGSLQISSLNKADVTQDLQPVRQMPAEPDIAAHSYAVQIIGDKRPLLSRRISKQMYPASLTKILTSVVAIQNLRPDLPIVFSSLAKSTGEKESHAPVGETFTRDDVMRFCLIESANDAAVALAEAIGKERGAFSFDDAMLLFKQAANQKAQELGMTSSRFENPTGLDDKNHYTTAEDLFRLVSYVWENHRVIWDVSRANDLDIHSLSNSVYSIKTTNQLLAEFPALLGGKTGLTDAAKGTLILLYPVKPDRVAAIIILGSDDRFEDGRKLIHWIEDAFNN